MKLTLNLASRSYINRRALYLVYAVSIALLVLLLVVHIFLYVRTLAQSDDLQERLATFEQELAGERMGGAEVNAQAYDQMLTEIAFANEILVQDSFRWTALLNRLEEVVPERVVIRGIQPDYSSGSLNLSGAAMGVEDLRNFLDRLMATPRFRDVYLLQQARQAAGRGGSGEIVFTVVVRGAF